MTSSSKAPDFRPLVLLVEDEDSVRRSLQLFLTGRGYRVRAFAAVAPVIADATCGEAALLVADYRLPDGDGITLLTGLRGRGWTGRAVLVTAFPSERLTSSARSAGYANVIEKPLRHQELLSSLGAA
ncbi:response regulator [Sphingomonas psychrotolerans]|uniref:Response regulator n=1 Tax=Sphingomonas psychrotolerans TaxID=1327635 RepID=A0ABU3N1V4_9SPHN|nr:response regulator [Sphingomonas psychrotolerans]MDT8758467.1 response regulator [Sphingomonas psychrotolerans]